MKTDSTQKKPKTKISLTLDAHDADVCYAAAALASRIRPPETLRTSQRNFFIKWALRSVGAAVIRYGAMPCPLGVQLTNEHPDDQLARCGFLLRDDGNSEGGTPNHVNDALAWFAKRYWPQNKISLEEVAQFLLKVALAHPEEMAGWIYAFASYRDAEGFESDQPLLNSMVQGRKEYRRGKTKLRKS